MYIVDVIPISKSRGKGPLSYFSKHNLEPGTLVRIPVRKQEKLALVHRTYDIKEVKGDIKGASFSLKNISGVVSGSPITRDFVHASSATADFFATSVGAVIFSLIPKKVFELEEFPHTTSTQEKPELLPETLAFQTSYDQRIDAYRTLIRESFAKKRSVTFYVPTHSSGEHLYQELCNGIEEHVQLIIAPKKKPEYFREFLEYNPSHPQVYIVTPSFAFINFPDVDTAVIEDESSSHYYTLQRPYIDKRYFLKKLAHQRGQTLILSDTLLSYETLEKLSNHEVQEFLPLSYRLFRPDSLQITCNTKESSQEKSSPKFIITQSIKQSLGRGNHIFLLAPRTGYASLIMCNDCGHVVSCDTCNTPLSLRQELVEDSVQRKRSFFCRNCNTTTATFDVCKICGGVRITLLGQTVEKVAEDVRGAFPEIPTILVSSEHTRTKHQARKAIEAFFTHERGIMIGTSLALNTLLKPVDESIILSLDALLAHPAPQTYHNALRTIAQVEQFTRGSVTIHHRNDFDDFLKILKGGNVNDFIQQELSDRKELSYPPFSVMILLQKSISRSQRASAEKFFSEKFSEYYPIVLMQKTAKANILLCKVILRSTMQDWMNTSSPIHKLLQKLPESFTLQINPPSLA